MDTYNILNFLTRLYFRVQNCFNPRSTNRSYKQQTIVNPANGGTRPRQVDLRRNGRRRKRLTELTPRNLDDLCPRSEWTLCCK